MSNFLSEAVPPMPPMGCAIIESVAEYFLAEVYPEALKQPTALPFHELVDMILQQKGICVRPASFAEMGERVGATDPATSSCIDILLREDIWADLFVSGRRSNFAKSTTAHELGHAILHVPIMRKRIDLHAAVGAPTMNRMQRSQLPAYRDPEWQAWTFAGAIIAPMKTLVTVQAGSVAEVAEIYGVSESMMRTRLVRTKLIERFER